MFVPGKSVLLVIDVQGKLAYLMHEKENLFKHIQGLIKMAGYLKIPILVTEQVPEKIGPTIPEVTQLLPRFQPIKKVAFSCCLENTFLAKLKLLQRKQIIVCGIEAHVCVVQTVFDLVKKKYAVQVVADAVSSRHLKNKTIALDRIQSMGAEVTTTEMIATELLRTSTHPQFKEILNLIR